MLRTSNINLKYLESSRLSYTYSEKSLNKIKRKLYKNFRDAFFNK